MPFFVYMLSNKRHGTLYVGVTNDLSRRMGEHKSKTMIGFSSRYGLDRLVWYEVYDDATSAIVREKSLKRWHRHWKTRLVDAANLEWSDLTPSLHM